MIRTMKLHISAVIAIFALFDLSSMSAQAQGDAKTGGQMFRVCASCHSLQPGVHLSGPSLADLWGKKAASIAGFGRYTKALGKIGIIWDENALNAWLADPGAMAPGTTMTFRGIEENGARANLIAFLKVAMAKNGLAKAVRSGWISERMAMGQIPPDLSAVEPDRRITRIRHCGDAFIVSTADGSERPFWESNVRIKIDTSTRGPKNSDAVLLRSGMVGDRVSIVFSSLGKLKAALTKNCE